MTINILGEELIEKVIAAICQTQSFVLLGGCDLEQKRAAIREFAHAALTAILPDPREQQWRPDMERAAELLANFARDRFANTKELTWSTMGEHSQQYFRDAVEVVRAALTEQQEEAP